MAAEHEADLKKKEQPLWVPFLFLAFGVLFIAGAYVAASRGEWPIFLPPQVDLFRFVFGFFGQPVGGYLAAIFLFALGVGSAWLGVAALRLRNHA
jgi:hypothetical protein